MQSLDLLLSAPSRILFQTHVYPALKADGRVEEVLPDPGGRDTGAPSRSCSTRSDPARWRAPSYDALVVRINARPRGKAICSPRRARSRRNARPASGSPMTWRQRGGPGRAVRRRAAQSRVPRRVRRRRQPRAADADHDDLRDEPRPARASRVRWSREAVQPARRHRGGVRSTATPHRGPARAQSRRGRPPAGGRRSGRHLARVVRARSRASDVACRTTGQVEMRARPAARVRRGRLHRAGGAQLPEQRHQVQPAGTTISVDGQGRGRRRGGPRHRRGSGPARRNPPSACSSCSTAPPSAISQAAGAGIGLFVCRELIHAMGGRIWAAAASATGGAEFGFWLPAAADLSED